MDHLAFLGFDFSKITEANLTIAFVGYMIVFIALILLALLFNALPNLLNYRTKSRLKKQGKEQILNEMGSTQIIGEEGAAIAAAIHLYFNDLHDEEDHVLTISRISKNYSPWSSKIYGVTRDLNKRF